MFVHAADAANSGHKKSTIRTVDTDVVVLAIYVVQQLGVDELWIDFVVGKSRRYIASHSVSVAIENTKSKCLPFFHALTGCDTTSSFLGHEKKTAWDAWASFPAVTEFFEQMSAVPEKPSMTLLNAIKRFIIILYDRTSTCTDIDMARKYSLERGDQWTDFHQHRRHYTNIFSEKQGGYVWG